MEDQIYVLPENGWWKSDYIMIRPKRRHQSYTWIPNMDEEVGESVREERDQGEEGGEAIHDYILADRGAWKRWGKLCL